MAERPDPREEIEEGRRCHVRAEEDDGEGVGDRVEPRAPRRILDAEAHGRAPMRSHFRQVLPPDTGSRGDPRAGIARRRAVAL